MTKKSKEILRKLRFNGKMISSLALLKNGNIIVAGLSKCDIQIFNPLMGCCVKEFSFYQDSKWSGYVNSMLLLPDGNVLAAGCKDEYFTDCQILRIFNPETGNVVEEFKGPWHGINTMLYHPDGMVLLAASGSIKVFDLAEARHLKQFYIRTKQVHSLFLLKDNILVVVAQEKNEYTLYNYDLDERSVISEYPLTPEQYEVLEEPDVETRAALKTGEVDLSTFRIFLLSKGDANSEFLNNVVRISQLTTLISPTVLLGNNKEVIDIAFNSIAAGVIQLYMESINKLFNENNESMHCTKKSIRRYYSRIFWQARKNK